MARPEEKAQAMMNKWVKMREEGNQTGIKPRKGKRPFLASQCEHLDDAEYYRRQIVREISELLGKIQNSGLLEHTIRDMNDDINKKMREKFHWNKRIKQLGGPDFNQIERRQQKEQLQEGGSLQEDAQLQAFDNSGYKYYGAAKDLPGVRELFEKAAKKAMKRKRGDINKYLTPDYYGWREEEDGVLLELEEEASKRNAERWKEYVKKRRLENEVEDEDSEEDDEDDFGSVVPSQELIAKAILERKKQALLERFSL